MKRTISVLVLCIAGALTINLRAQESRFFIPSEIVEAYDNGTRSYDGKPGPAYWQNTADYTIKVKLSIPEKLVEGYEEVVYHNNSPDNINSLVIRLYGDAYKIGNSRAERVNELDIYEGVELWNVSINGDSVNMNNGRGVRRSATNIRFSLNEPLLPGEDLTFCTSWKQMVPAYSTIRTGASDSTTFLLAYWYPQVSVYDDMFGWDEHEYTFTTEFYNNLGNYDVEVTVPEQFLVRGTGRLMNAGEVLPQDNFQKYLEAGTSQEPVQIVSPADIGNGIRYSGGSWHFTAEEVSDFAMAVSDHYAWSAAMQPVDGREVLISSIYPAEDTTGDYPGHIALQQLTMNYFSTVMPGIPYPYEAFTTFVRSGGRRGGGMEYPMMASNGGTGAGVTIHEMFHTYFPMYVRTNERVWAWMDEGWASFNTSFMSWHYFEKDFEIANLYSDILGRGIVSGTIGDLPLITSSEFTTDVNYRSSAYSVPATIYAMLYQHLGEAMFLDCYREYIRRWAKKSPSPYDFFFTFENVSGEDLGWLWKPWFFEFGAPDLSVKSFEKGVVTVENIGTRPVPVVLEVVYRKGNSDYINREPGIWKDGKKKVSISVPDADEVERIILNGFMPEKNRMDNFYPSLDLLYEGFEIPDAILGNYGEEGRRMTLSITRRNNILYFHINPYGLSRIIYPDGDMTFRMIEDPSVLKFTLDETGKCTGLALVGSRGGYFPKLD